MNIPTVIRRWGYLFEEDTAMRERTEAAVVVWWRRLRRWGQGIPLRRAIAVVLAVALWMGTGGMTASGVIPPVGSGFGEIHWYSSPPAPVGR